jgi:hypothetical protein
MSNIGIVYEIIKNDVVVLTPEGEFVIIKRKKDDVSLGMAIEFDDSSIRGKRNSMLSYFPLVSAIAALIVIGFIFAYPAKISDFNSSVFAYIDIDINPSVELVVDKKGVIIATSPLNDDAKALLGDIMVKGQPVHEALSDIVEAFGDSGYISLDSDNMLMISVSLNQQNSEYMKDADIAAKKVDEILFKMHKEIMVMSDKKGIMLDPVIVKISSKERAEAKEHNLSMGRYHLYVESKQYGLDIELSNLNNIKISELFGDLKNSGLQTLAPTLDLNIPDASRIGGGALKIQHYSIDKQIDTQGINYTFTIVNNGTDTIDLRNVKVRYYFWEENNEALNFAIYYYGAGEESDVHGEFYDIPEGYKANKYLEITFSNGIANPGDVIHVRGIFHYEDWSRFDQSDDYSFNPEAEEFVDWGKMTIYIQDKLIWGEEP